MRPIRHTAYICAAIAVSGCSNPYAGNTAPVQSAPMPRAAALNSVTSEVLSGTREKGPYAGSWYVQIDVLVKASGPAFGHFQSTYFTVYGSTLIDDRTTWFISNSDGWPDSYKVLARYREWTDTKGEVTVEVKVDDTSHSAWGDVVYSARHPIQWEKETKP